MFIRCHDLHRDSDQGSVLSVVVSTMDNVDSASSSQEARQLAIRMAPAGNCLSKQRDRESGERNGCVLQRETPSEISEETPKFRTRPGSAGHHATAVEISTPLIYRAFPPERAARSPVARFLR